MEYNQQYQERLALFKDTINMKKTSRIPMASCVFTWKALDSDYGYKLSEVLTDYEKNEKVMREFHERYQFDTYIDMNTRNIVGHLSDLGSSCYRFNDEEGTVNFVNTPLMEESEYGRFINDNGAFTWEMFLRKYPDITVGRIMNAIPKVSEYGNYCSHIVNVMAEEYGVPAITDWGVPTVGANIELIYSYYRGIKGFSVDLRKHKSEIHEMCDLLTKMMIEPALDALLKGATANCVVDCYTGWLAHSVLNNKQFDEFFWPEWKRILDAFANAGKTIYIFAESSMMRFADHLKDYPKGTIVLHPEADDIFELRKKLPNVCLAGGMKTELLGYGTPEECVDYAKRLIDGMGEGFIFSQDKMISFKNDCTRENLLAVNNFVREYRP